MKRRMVCCGVVLVGAFLGNTLAWADPPQRREMERLENNRHDTERRDGDRHGPSAYFHDEHRAMVRDYYGQTYRESSRCPPGLAKKHNGCLPPGQAKLWRRGYALPREVIYYDVEPAVLMRLGPPPAGHRFVRVAGDILLIAIGTGLVIDAIEDLGR